MMVFDPATRVFFNEFHYDNDGSDTGEFIEIANTAQVDLTGWTVMLYNGSNDTAYNTITLGGSELFTVLDFPSNGIQNGAPDGLALVDPDGNVVQFLSYEGTMTASDGPAAGLTSTDIGVSETGTTPVGFSLQLSGSGETAGDFVFVAPAAETKGTANNDQTIVTAEPVLIINEIHYDNDGADTGEFIEVAGTAGLDLAGYLLVLYNGNGGAPYNTIALSGIVDDESAGYGAVDFQLPSNGLQNGSPDGVALVAPDGTVLQFLSYEGPMVAVGGPADGMTSTDIGVAESGSTPVGFSLQVSDDGTWTGPLAATAGTLNAGQTFGGGSAPQPGALSVDDVSTIEGDSGTTAFVFTVTRSGGSDGAVSTDWAVAFGSADAADLTGATSGTVNFADGETSAIITVSVIGDTAIEADESFTVELSNPQGGATILDGSGDGTILNDDVDTTPVGPAQVFVNEVHYDNAGPDVGEAVEIAGPAGADLSGWLLVLYNGNGGVAYNTIALSGIIPDQDDGFGTLGFAVSGIQNGSPDAFALVDPAGRVIQFLSYEGTLTATSGPAIGLTSTDIGVAEDGGTPEGFSVQLTGSGNVAADFTWQNPSDDSFGAVNAGQDFTPANANGTLYVGDATVTEGDGGTTAITFDVFRVGGTSGEVTVDYVAVFGAAFTDADATDFFGPTSGTVIFADGQRYATVMLEVAGDVVPEPNEFFDLVLSDATGGADIGVGTGSGAILNDDPLDLLVGEIQGAGHRSVYEGNEVTTRGIVTAVTDRGFYLQGAGDGNMATSDAILVFTGDAPTVALGDAVEVTGTVVEFLAGGDTSNLTITEIVDPAVTVTSSGNALPEAVLIGPEGIAPPTEIIDDDQFTAFDPENDGIDFWESLEGMRVTVQNPVAVDSTNGFGELWTVASDGAGELLATNVSESGLVVLEGGEGGLGVFNSGAGSDFNPERIQIDVAGALNGFILTVPDVMPGAVLDDVTGIVDYSFGNYEVRPTEAITVASASTNEAEVTALTGAENQVSLATYNVLNLDINDADGDADVANGRFEAVAYDIAVNLALPDIVVLQEVQDDSGSTNDGTVSAQLTLEALADAIFAESGVQYSVFDNPFVVNGETGGQPGGNIRVAFLYRDDRVDFDEASAFTITDPDDGTLADAFQGSRAPLGGTFAFNGEELTVIGNHFTSKIGSDNIFSANQPPANAGALARAAQAAAVNAYIDALLALDPNANIAVAGDFNEFQFEEPMQVLTGELDYAGGMESNGSNTVLTNLTYFLAPEERYSVLFQGNAQQLDHILATGNLASGAAVDVVHVNIPTGGFVSDHDPVLARFNLGTRTIAGGNGKDALEGNDGNDILLGGNGEDALFGRGGDDALYGDNGADWLFGG
ncbi:MAG: lamin tail domain-containing protein, partial [Alteraurantiacibacter sp.]